MMELPWPPSVNTYWRRSGHSTYISKRGREYRETVVDLVKANGWDFELAGRLSVSVVCWPPDRRKRDLDNVLKSLLDSLEHAGVFVDDGQIDELRVVRGEVGKPGGVMVSVSERVCIVCGAVIENADAGVDYCGEPCRESEVGDGA